MTNEELNRKMADVCKFPVSDKLGAEYPRVLIQGKSLIFLEDDDPLLRGTVIWNPCGDWNQVHGFVVPALERLGFNWMMWRDAPDSAEVEVSETRSAGRPVCATSSSGADVSLSRRFCEAALEAFEQLEEKS